MDRGRLTGIGLPAVVMDIEDDRNIVRALIHAFAAEGGEQMPLSGSGQLEAAHPLLLKGSERVGTLEGRGGCVGDVASSRWELYVVAGVLDDVTGEQSQGWKPSNLQGVPGEEGTREARGARHLARLAGRKNGVIEREDAKTESLLASRALQVREGVRRSAIGAGMSKGRLEGQGRRNSWPAVLTALLGVKTRGRSRRWPPKCSGKGGHEVYRPATSTVRAWSQNFRSSSRWAQTRSVATQRVKAARGSSSPLLKGSKRVGMLEERRRSSTGALGATRSWSRCRPPERLRQKKTSSATSTLRARSQERRNEVGFGGKTCISAESGRRGGSNALGFKKIAPGVADISSKWYKCAKSSLKEDGWAEFDKPAYWRVAFNDANPEN
ncbi:hypothetical protein FPV67DRAFT_1456802 [Lyophyllum atratum]|nr:hypothetical protein FPV67DRAFT_1456802 [Lyophyllum atratum]